MVIIGEPRDNFRPRLRRAAEVMQKNERRARFVVVANTRFKNIQNRIVNSKPHKSNFNARAASSANPKHSVLTGFLCNLLNQTH